METFSVEITQEDIDCSVPVDSNNCAIVKALLRKGLWASVTLEEITIFNLDLVDSAKLPYVFSTSVDLYNWQWQLIYKDTNFEAATPCTISFCLVNNSVTIC